MAIRISHISLSLDQEESSLPTKAAEACQIPPDRVREWKIVKKSLDARGKSRIHFVYSLELGLSPEEEKNLLLHPPAGLKVEEAPPPPPPAPLPAMKKEGRPRPLIVGTGPAGLFAALKLIQNGFSPLILERGKEVAARVRDVNRFWEEGELDEESNVQFGEGGAGTFSDGKLYTRLNDPRIPPILEALVGWGAPAEILYLQRPHIGTDRLRRVVVALRRSLEEGGAEFRFQARVTGLRAVKGRLVGVVVNGKEEIDGRTLLLAPGHSARDTYRMLREAGAALEPKPFALGLRVEHPQGLIDRIQHGPSAGHPRVPPAEYQLTFRTARGRAVYSFCMCPGGAVIGAGSERGGVATNGMSSFRRSSPFANSALVVSVGPEDFGGTDALSGVEFQRRWEARAFELGGGSYRAPAQALFDFIRGKDPGACKETSFRPGVTPARLDQCLPDFAAESLREAIPHFDRKVRGFSSKEALLIGVETRTSAPVRILRREDGQSATLPGLFPVGEGSGYAGGIISSALDGMKGAEAAIRQLG